MSEQRTTKTWSSATHVTVSHITCKEVDRYIPAPAGSRYSINIYDRLQRRNLTRDEMNAGVDWSELLPGWEAKTETERG